MTIEIWLAFVAVSVVFAIIPGPTVILVVSQAITHGKKSVLPLVLGTLCGDFIAMSLSLVGVGAILLTSAKLFLTLKWIGVAYLVYLGIKSWREEPPNMTSMAADDITVSKREMFQSSFIVTALNPKSIVFFMAFFPQFLNPEAQTVPQLIILMATFLGIISITITSFALFAGLVSNKIQSYKARKMLNRLGGVALIGAGILTSMMQRQQG